MALVLKRQFVNGRALALQTKYRDPSAVLTRGPRHLFLVPWRGRTLVGVNSLIWRDEPDSLRVTEAEVADFVAEIAEADPKLGLTMDDVALVMAGLLPVEKGDETTGDVSFGKRPLVVDNAKHRQRAGTGVRHLQPIHRRPRRGGAGGGPGLPQARPGGPPLPHRGHPDPRRRILPLRRIGTRGDRGAAGGRGPRASPTGWRGTTAPPTARCCGWPASGPSGA